MKLLGGLLQIKPVPPKWASPMASVQKMLPVWGIPAVGSILMVSILWLALTFAMRTAGCSRVVMTRHSLPRWACP
jgi:hypothetical protein